MKQQLGEQRIYFASLDQLTEEEKNWKPGSKCLIEYAGQQLTTGKQAECYANYYIAMHMRRSAANAAVDGEKLGWDNETYATLGTIQRELRAQITAAKEKGDEQTVAALQKKLDAATSLRSTLQTGETLRGLPLTTYGFSVLTDKAAIISIVAFALGGLLIVLAIPGYIHAFFTSPEEVVFAPKADT